jgi:hypothetical protein
MLDPIQIFQNTLADPEPEPGARAETSRFRLRLQPKVSAPCGSGSTTLPGLRSYTPVQAVRGKHTDWLVYSVLYSWAASFVWRVVLRIRIHFCCSRSGCSHKPHGGSGSKHLASWGLLVWKGSFGFILKLWGSFTYRYPDYRYKLTFVSFTVGCRDFARFKYCVSWRKKILTGFGM